MLAVANNVVVGAATVNIGAVQVQFAASPCIVGCEQSNTVGVTVTPDDAPVQFTIQNTDPIQTTDYAEIVNWDATEGLSVYGMNPGIDSCEIQAKMPDGTLLASDEIDVYAVEFDPTSLNVLLNSSASLAATVTPDTEEITLIPLIRALPRSTVRQQRSPSTAGNSVKHRRKPY